jgi:hypothetical protein
MERRLQQIVARQRIAEIGRRDRNRRSWIHVVKAPQRGKYI